jgi:hypothetical protein
MNRANNTLQILEIALKEISRNIKSLPVSLLANQVLQSMMTPEQPMLKQVSQLNHAK